MGGCPEVCFGVVVVLGLLLLGFVVVWGCCCLGLLLFRVVVVWGCCCLGLLLLLLVLVVVVRVVN